MVEVDAHGIPTVSIIAFALSLSSKRTRQGSERACCYTSPNCCAGGSARHPAEDSFRTRGECHMWKRDEAANRPGSHSRRRRRRPTPAAPPAAAEAAPAPAHHKRRHTPRTGGKTVNIGKSVIIKGELNGSEDLTIEGQVEGKIELRQNVLTIGPNGKIKAQVFAKSVIILGEVTGNVTATEKVDIRDNGSVDGDIAAPRVAIAEGAHFRGSIDMQRAGAQAGRETRGAGRAEAKPAARRPPAQPTPARYAVSPGPGGQPTSTCARSLAPYHGGAGSIRISDRLRHALTDLLKWGGKRPIAVGRGAMPRPRDEPVVASKAFPKFVATLAPEGSAGRCSISGRSSVERRVLRRTARLQAVHRGPARRRRPPPASGTAKRPRRRHRRPASRTPTAASTASCAGTSSTSSTRPRRRRWRADRPRAAARRARDGLLLHDRRRAGAVHEVRDRRRPDPAPPPSPRRRRQEAEPAEPRHHPDVRGPGRVAIRSC